MAENEIGDMVQSTAPSAPRLAVQIGPTVEQVPATENDCKNRPSVHYAGYLRSEAKRISQAEISIEKLPHSQPHLISPVLNRQPLPLTARTCSGQTFNSQSKLVQTPLSFEDMVAARSTVVAGRARKSYYGINIHQLLDDNATDAASAERSDRPAEADIPRSSTEQECLPPSRSSKGKTLMWTEKYRARKFTDLVGDERTHRSVLRWMKSWDPIVFPGAARLKAQKQQMPSNTPDDRPHRKVLLLHGPPGLGKTTLAHVCARQAGYEVLEINASDERSRDVVRGRIKDIVGTENVRAATGRARNGRPTKANRPVCVVVDEVDGVVSGNGAGGEGGFIKALIDLVLLDQKTSIGTGSGTSMLGPKKKGGDKFRILRPMILICNDVYHQSLRPLRQSGLAEIISLRKPPLNLLVSRMKNIFEKEDIPCDSDAVRRLCEATWGVSSRKETSGRSSTGEGDIRGVLVVGEWVASKLRSSNMSCAIEPPRLTRKWLDINILSDLAHNGSGSRNLGLANAKDVVERIFLDRGGFPETVGPPKVDCIEVRAGDKIASAEASKTRTMERLREMIDTIGDFDRIVTDCFTIYPDQPYQDDTYLSKPGMAYDWLYFHDSLSSKVYSGQEWELNPYLNQAPLAFHHLFASPGHRARESVSAKETATEVDDREPIPFTGPRADFASYEAQKQNKSILLGLQSSLSISLLRAFRSPEEIATELVPFVTRLLAPDVHPVVVGGGGGQQGIASVRKDSERAMVQRAVEVMKAVGVCFDKTRLETESGIHGGFIYRMEPPLDILTTFGTAGSCGLDKAPVRYAVRQVLDQEYHKDQLQQRADARQRRYKGIDDATSSLDGIGRAEKENQGASLRSKSAGMTGAKRDFFGRIINEARPAGQAGGTRAEEEARKKSKRGDALDDENKVWVSYHEGFSNAVRRLITLEELMRSF